MSGGDVHPRDEIMRQLADAGWLADRETLFAGSVRVDLAAGYGDGAGMPGYWMHEMSGVLAPVVKKYLEGVDLDEQEVAVMRAYLRQWVLAPVWRGLPGEPAGLEQLRRDVDGLTSSGDVKAWLERAVDLGIDPL